MALKMRMRLALGTVRRPNLTRKTNEFLGSKALCTVILCVLCRAFRAHDAKHSRRKPRCKIKLWCPTSDTLENYLWTAQYSMYDEEGMH